MLEDLIPEGVVDERSIEDVSPTELKGFTQCHFFAGIGGWSYALRLAGWPDSEPVWTGSCPCQPFSVAGEGRGFNDDRHLWPAWKRLIAERRPPTVFGEQVEAAVGHGWLDLVQADLEALDYAVGEAVFPAACVGAPHRRQRLYFVADADRVGRAMFTVAPGASNVAGAIPAFWTDAEWVRWPDGKRRAVKPGVRALAHGVPGGVDALRGAGNAIVPQQAAEFVRCFIEVMLGDVASVDSVALRAIGERKLADCVEHSVTRRGAFVSC